MALRTDYKDDILDLTQNTQRKYRMITNADGTISFEDVTIYSQVGDSFGAAELNEIANSVNEGGSNMYYNPETDEKFLKGTDGEWHFDGYGGLGRTYIYNEGYINTALVGNLVQGGDTSDSLSDKAPVFNPTTISLPTTSSNSECNLRTDSTVDINNYNELGVSIIDGLAKKEYTVDISGVNGSYYLGVKQSYSEYGISTILAVSNNTTFLSTYLQASTNFRYRETPTDENKTCIISQMWLK